MKALIDYPLTILWDYDEDDLEYYKDICKQYSIYFKHDSNYFTIHEQKIVLDEWEMNNLLYNCITELFNVTITYTPLGGYGCDFCIRILPKIMET